MPHALTNPFRSRQTLHFFHTARGIPCAWSEKKQDGKSTSPSFFFDHIFRIAATCSKPVLGLKVARPAGTRE